MPGFWSFFLFLFVIGLSPLVIRLFFGSSKSQESSKRHSTKPKLSEREKKLDYLSTITLCMHASPENRTYDTTGIPLTFTVTETTSWIGYSLDGQANNTIAGNTTLTELSDGMHSLIVYAKDTAGNTGASETIYFTIAQQIEAFPTWVVAAIVITAVVGVALLIYFAKVKKTTEKAEK